MPTTYNGIGTHYYGKGNPSAHTGRCKSCGATALLTSYDTRLWFVVVFIPVIPLGRKRILDDCSSCRRHFQVPLQKWDEMQQLGVSSAKAAFEKEGTVESALAYHQTLLNFHEHDAATSFRAEMVRRFPNDAELHAYLGDVLLTEGRVQESEASFLRAYELKPDLPAARLGRANGLIRGGQLDEARAMLDFMEQPGAEHLGSIGALETLALAYQAKGRNQEALELFARLLQAYPAAGKDSTFRKRVRTSEKARPATPSLLPGLSLWERLTLGPMRLVSIGAAIALVVVVAGLAQNFYTRGHRLLHVVNGYDQPLTVVLDGGEARSVTPRGHAEFDVAEGRHTLLQKGPVDATDEINLTSSLFGRWSDEAFVFNPAGKALVLEVEQHYRSGNGSVELRYHTGRTFERIADIDHPFTTMPMQVSIEKGKHEKVLVGLEVAKGTVAAPVYWQIQDKKPQQAMVLAERLMPQHGDDPSVAGLYLQAAEKAKLTTRARQFIEKQLAVRPAAVGVHLAWQRAVEPEPGGAQKLLAYYDDALNQSPNDSTMLYLRGRVTEDLSVRHDFLNRAITLDPAAPWPHYSLAFDALLAADWKAACAHMEIAIKGLPDDPNMKTRLLTAMMGAHNYDELAARWRAALSGPNASKSVAFELAEVLIAKGDLDSLDDLRAPIRRLSQDAKTRTSDLRELDSAIALLKRDYSNVLRVPPATPTLSYQHSQALLMSDGVEQLLARKDVQEQLKQDFGQALAFALACEIAGKTKEATDCLKLAGEQTTQLSERERQTFAKLISAEQPAFADYQSLRIDPEDLAVLGALLGRRNRAESASFFERARQLNVRLCFPAALIDKALGAR